MSNNYKVWNAASETVHLTKYIEHRDVVERPKQQLSWLFFVAQTSWLVVVELMFLDDDASQCELSVEQQNTTIVVVRYKYVTVRVNGNVWSVAEWW